MFTTNDTHQQLSVLLVAGSDDRKGPVLDMLLTEPAHLAVADSPEEAQSRFAAEMPDVVFLLDSPSLDAFSLFEQMRNRWGCRLHGVIISDNDDRANWKRAITLGVTDYLTTPLEPATIKETVQRIRNRAGVCFETSRHLLDASRYDRIFDTMPWGVVLIGTGEQIIRTNKTADSLLSLSGRPMPHTVDELMASLFGPKHDEQLMQARSALNNGQPWHDTLFMGRKTLALHLTAPPLPGDSGAAGPSGLLTLLDLTQTLSAGFARPALLTAAFDLLFSHHLPPKEQARLAELITEGTLPTPEPFALPQLLDECRQRSCQNCSNPVSISLNIAEQVPENLMGQAFVLRETVLALLEWGGRESGNGSVALSVSLQGQQENSVAIRFQVSAVERRLTSSNYRSGDEYIADEIGCSGPGAIKQVHGIGLATILTSRLGSSLIVRSVAKEGKTASFDLWFNRSAASRSASPPPQQEEVFMLWNTAAGKTPEGGLRILVAEDNPLEQRSLESVLTRLGHTVVIVGNGREAVEEFEQNRFDLVLLDILMPVMDGFEAVRLIREREQLLDLPVSTPVLALTSYTLKAVKERCSKAGMNGYLAKPVTAEKAGQVFRQFLNPDPSDADMPCSSIDRQVLDYEHLEYDRDLYREMIDLFIVHGLPLFNDLEKLLEAGGPSEELHQIAHKLKGMTANIGAGQMQQLMKELQDTTTDSQPVDCNRFLQELRQDRQNLVGALHEIDWDNYRQPA